MDGTTNLKKINKQPVVDIIPLWFDLCYWATQLPAGLKDSYDNLSITFSSVSGGYLLSVIIHTVH
jgi:hypothetical protein